MSYIIEVSTPRYHSHTTVATLDEARDYVRPLIAAAPGITGVDFDRIDDVFADDGNGAGTIGPLPDGTLIEVKRTTLATLAGEAYAQFEQREEAIIALRDDAPEWLRDLVRDAHGDFLPDDWRYAAIRAALSHVHDSDYADADEARDGIGEFADGHVDVYTHARLQWLASNLNRTAYCDEAADDFGGASDGIVGLIGLGQYRESEEVYASVVDSLEQRLAELDD